MEIVKQRFNKSDSISNITSTHDSDDVDIIAIDNADEDADGVGIANENQHLVASIIIAFHESFQKGLGYIYV